MEYVKGAVKDESRGQGRRLISGGVPIVGLCLQLSCLAQASLGPWLTRMRPPKGVERLHANANVEKGKIQIYPMAQARAEIRTRVGGFKVHSHDR